MSHRHDHHAQDRSHARHDAASPKSRLVDPIIGIDLGTTNSLVAYVRNGSPEILHTDEGDALIPSIVSCIDGQITVGRDAKAKRVEDSGYTAFSVKRLLGKNFADLQSIQEKLPYLIQPKAQAVGEGQSESVELKLGDRVFSPVEISAFVLQELKRTAEARLQVSVRRVVITVPAYFDDAQRQATRLAARLAGLDVLRMINEPTAASLAYGLDRKRQGLIAVYDLGGGTFDISILRLHDGIFEVLATNGDTTLGGDDLDRAIASELAKGVQSPAGQRSPGDQGMSLSIQKFGETSGEFKALLTEKAEALKIALSSAESVSWKFEWQGWRYERQWTRAELEKVMAPIIEQTRAPCQRALQDAGLDPSLITDVILVGGSTRVPQVRSFVSEVFGREPNVSLNPDEVVALGAAVQADILAGNNPDLLLLDVVSLSLGIETYGGVMSVLIPRNSKIPIAAREVFTTFVENQTGVDVHVLQGERDRVEDNRSLARFKLKGIAPSPAGMPRVEVTFLIDADGILQVTAKDLRTGNLQAIEVKPASGLNEAEINRMLQAKTQNHSTDQAYRNLVNARNEAETLIRSTDKNREAARRLLAPEEYSEVEKYLESLRTQLTSEDASAIRAGAFQLDRSTRRLAELMVNEAIRNALRS